MKTLITGATGFVGAAVSRELLKKGHKVKALVRQSSVLDNLKNLDVEIVHGDLKDKDSLTRATKGFKSGVDWIYRRDTSNQLPLFFRKTRQYDKIRNENTVEVFPEWKELFEKYDKN